MTISRLHFISCALALSINSSFAVPPYRPHAPQKQYSVIVDGHKIIICDGILSLPNSSDGLITLIVEYRPSTRSSDKRMQIAEITAVAQHFVSLALLQKAGLLCIKPILYPEFSGEVNVVFPYVIRGSMAIPEYKFSSL